MGNQFHNCLLVYVYVLVIDHLKDSKKNQRMQRITMINDKRSFVKKKKFEYINTLHGFEMPLIIGSPMPNTIVTC